MKIKYFIVFLVCILLCSACSKAEEYPIVSRESTLPADITKRTADSDMTPPIMHSNEFETPIPLPYPVNTSGGEDSPFILPDGNTLYFFFTPDVRIPHNEQLTDDVTGIWVTCKSADGWTEPERVWLQDAGKLALDGAPFVAGNEMWFASAREGYNGMNIFTAKKKDGVWSDWQYVGGDIAGRLNVGELHIYEDELYYHSDREGGMGNYDIWMAKKEGDGWSEAKNIAAVNTPEMDGFPFISPDGGELWFTRVYQGSPAIYRSIKLDGEWQTPELIVSQFAGEPTLDAQGNLYFVHHFYENGVMIEADIYVAYKKPIN
ncbi:MAG: PD40 domain-containing protein [Clostridia bacterium]|nr:PD40 domain-containing protein [Clostridia bacterium]